MGNPHRKRGTGKGTSSAWQNRASFEGEPVAPEVFAQPTRGKYKTEVIDIVPRKPVKSGDIHAGPSISENNTEGKGFSVEQDNQDRVADLKKRGKSVYRTSPTPETAKRKPLHEISAEESITAFEDEIAGDFREDERRYVRQWVDIYPAEFQKAIEKREKNGRKITEKDLPVIRLSFINDIARWGIGRGMASEKAEFLEKYLELKLPIGIPEEETQKPSENTEKVNNEVQQNLTIKNKHMEIPIKEIKNIREQLKQDSEELAAAEMMPNVADPKSSAVDSPGEKGKKIEEVLSDQAKINQRKINKARGFAQKGMPMVAKKSMDNSDPVGASSVSDDVRKQEGIQKGAWELFKNRKALDPDNEETEPSEFDLRAAAAAYDAVQTQNKAEEPFNPPAIIYGSKRERSVVPVKSEEYTAEPIQGEPQRKALEGNPEKNIEELKADLEAKRRVFAQLDLDKSRKWAKLKNLLGSKIKEVSDDDHNKAWVDYVEANKKYFEARKYDVFSKGEKGSAKEFLLEFEGADEAIKLLNLKYDLKKEQSGYPAKALYGFEKLANGWKEMSWKKKLAVSAAIFGVGALAGLTGGASFGFIGATAFTLRTFQRTLGAGAMYVGAKRWQDTRSHRKISERAEGASEEFLSHDDWLVQIAALDYGKQIGHRLNLQKKEIEDLDRKHKKRALALAGLAGIGGTAFDMYRHGVFNGLGGAIKEKMLGSSILASSTSAEQYTSVQGMGSGAAATQAHEVTGGNIPESQFQKPPIVPEAEQPYHQEYSSENRATEGGVNYEESPKSAAFIEEAKSPATGAEVQTPEIAKPKFEDIAAVKIKPGGNMWGSIENNIKANPSAYGLDQTDPNFKTNMNGKISEMLHDFAKKNGLSYKQIDKVFAGDSFKIRHDDITGKPYLDDYQGKAFGGNVSHSGGVGATQEIASNKPNMAVDDVKPKAGIPPEDLKPRTGASVAPEHQPPRGEGRSPVPKEIQDWQDQAQADSRAANQHYEDVQKWKTEAGPLNARDLAIANDRLYLSTRGLLKNVFNGLGISESYNIFDQPMSEWDKLIGAEPSIAQDIRQADAIGISNENWNKLFNLREILKPYNKSGAESIGECLKKALADPNINKIGRGESIGARVTQLINELVLKNK